MSSFLKVSGAFRTQEEDKNWSTFEIESPFEEERKFSKWRVDGISEFCKEGTNYIEIDRDI